MAPAVRITDATGFDNSALCEAMNLSFSDYVVPWQQSEPVFSQMMQQRGHIPAASRIASINGQIAAIWLISRRGTDGYLISSGTVPAHRREGLSRRLAQSCLTGLRQQGVRHFQTEVICSNTGAHALYTDLGMQTARVLDCYDVPPVSPQANPGDIVEVPWSALRNEATALAEIAPSWQNSSASLDAIADHLRCWAAHDTDGLAGYVVVLPDGRTLAQIAIRKDQRRSGLATDLLAACHPGERLRVINADAGNAGFKAWMHSLGAKRTVSQYELGMALPA